MDCGGWDLRNGERWRNTGEIEDALRRWKQYIQINRSRGDNLLRYSRSNWTDGRSMKDSFLQIHIPGESDKSLWPRDEWDVERSRTGRGREAVQDFSWCIAQLVKHLDCKKDIVFGSFHSIIVYSEKSKFRIEDLAPLSIHECEFIWIESTNIHTVLICLTLFCNCLANC